MAVILATLIKLATFPLQAKEWKGQINKEQLITKIIIIQILITLMWGSNDIFVQLLHDPAWNYILVVEMLL